VAKQKAKGLKFLAILPSVILVFMAITYSETRKWYSENPAGCIFLISLLLFLTIFLWREVSDKGIKLVINRHGIWTKKTQLLSWENIDAFYFEQQNNTTTTYIFWIDTKITGVSFHFDITYLDTEPSLIVKAIETNSKENEIRYSGMHKFSS
jgi:hypothetical protein